MNDFRATASTAATLRIADVRVTPCRQRQQDPDWRFSRGRIPYIHGWIVTIEADNGLQGWGHVLATPVAGPDIDRTLLALNAAAGLLAGHDARRAEALHRLVEDTRSPPCVLSGLTSALFELRARAFGLPLHALLGGAARTRIPAARLIPIKPPDEMAHEARRLAGEGYRILKLKLDGRADDDVARVRAVRRALGDAIQLTVDANQAYDPDTAIDVCRALAALDVRLMEQPVAADDHDGLRRVTRARALPIEADESIGGSLATLARLIAMEAADSYNLKIPYFGGLRNTLAAARLCEAAGVGCRLGAIFGPRIASAQAAHLASVLNTVDGGAEIAESEHLLDDPFTGFDAHAGALQVAPGPGSGVAWTG